MLLMPVKMLSILEYITQSKRVHIIQIEKQAANPCYWVVSQRARSPMTSPLGILPKKYLELDPTQIKLEGNIVQGMLSNIPRTSSIFKARKSEPRVGTYVRCRRVNWIRVRAIRRTI